jgi:hypothetical protein
MAHPYLEQLQNLIRPVDPGDSELVCKHFFSGAALYADEKICALLTPAGLAFKLGEKRSEELISSQVAVPLCGSADIPRKGDYVLFSDPDELSDNALAAYFDEAIALQR